MRSFNIPKDEPIILAGDINSDLGTKEQHDIFEGNFLFHFKDPGFGSFSAATNWIVHAKYAGTPDDREWYLDYVATWADHLQPMEPAYMKIVKLKSKGSMYWQYLRDKKLSLKSECWSMRCPSNGLYNDVSDHYPVKATFKFPVDT